MKKILATASLCLASFAALAQSGTNSPYSRFGYGRLSDQAQGFNSGMNGVGLAFREHNQVNYLNPASYSAIDSITFIFDIGMSLQMTNFKENGKSKNANNADFEYAVGAFRLVRNVGMSFGILPFTNVGYDFSATQSVPGYNAVSSNTATDVTHTQNYSGNGGLHQAFIGAGWKTPIKGLSVGMNASYLWGTVSNYMTNTYSDNYVKSLAKQYSMSVHNYKLDFGAQYSLMLKNKDVMTVGLTYSPGHDLSTEPECLIIASNSQSSVNDTTRMTANGCGIPTQWGVGFAYKRAARWLFGLDYTIQRWSSVKFPVDNGNAYISQTDVFKDRHRINFGTEYCRNEQGYSFSERMRYRFGIGYTSPYLKVNGHDGPKEVSVSAGVGIPINRSILNVGVRWQNMSGKTSLTENTFLINIGMTFNERWFAKWKFE